MKSLVYVAVLLLIIPVQASLLSMFSLAGVKPDLALALIYIIGLLTGPTEAVLAGMGIGLIQDIGSAGLIGLNGLTGGLFGLCAGVLGTRVLDVASPSNVIFLTVFCLVEGIVSSVFLQLIYGTVPLFSMFFTHTLPEALYTGLLGTFIIRFIDSKNVMNMLQRRSLQKE